MDDTQQPVAGGSPTFGQPGKVNPPAKVAYILHLLLAGIVVIIGAAFWDVRGASPEVVGGTAFLMFAWFALPGLALLIVVIIYSVKGRSEWPLLVLLGLMAATVVALMTGTDETTVVIIGLGTMYVVGTAVFAILWFSRNRKKKLANPA
jgi:hypothetical protein